MVLLQENELPNWFSYPKDFLVIIEQNLLDFTPWLILTDERLRLRQTGIEMRYPNRQLIVFARREDNDEVACWENGRGVVVIKDFATTGFEKGDLSFSFWEWFRMVIETMIEFNSYE